MRSNNTQQHYLKIQEAAQRWNMSPVYVRRLVWAGELAAIKMGRAIRIPISEVERFESEKLIPSAGMAS